MSRSVITGSGSYIPDFVQANADFGFSRFYDADNKELSVPTDVLIEKFRGITGIAERRYADASLCASDMAAIAARRAIEDSGVDPETIDQLIIAHNFGDVVEGCNQSHALPSLANKVKNELGIRNPGCIAYDMICGCSGWVQSMIHSHAFFKGGIARKTLIIGADTVSRVVDRHDRDAMIFADGAGACVLEYKEGSDAGAGIISACAQSHSLEEEGYIYMAKSNAPGSSPCVTYLKMNGRKVYEYAISKVPAAIKQCLDEGGVSIRQVKKIFLHQANEKMDERILQNLYGLYDIPVPPENVMPMSIHWLGNSSVATVPTLFDMVRKQEMDGHELYPGDVIVFAAVGAGMNLNAVCYRY